MYSPLEQFEIKSIIRIYNTYTDISISNITIYLIMNLIIIITYLNYTINNNIIGTLYNKINEIFNTLLITQIKDMLNKSSYKYIPILITLFYFVLINNIVSLIPYSILLYDLIIKIKSYIATTSQIIITFTISITAMIAITLIAIYTHKLNFIKLFIPTNVPFVLLILLTPIEFISYLSRIFSLSIRLSCNILSGHILLKIISTFGYLISKHYIFLFFIPVLLISVLFILELAVSFIQSIIITILISSYIKDAIALH